MAQETQTHVITGAFGYSGRHIAKKLLAEGAVNVKTITGHPRLSGDRDGERKDLGERVAAMPFNFENPEALVESLRGVSVLYNTYWVRFDHGSRTHERAVANTRTLIDAAAAAGVERFVHVSITNPDESSHLPYFKGKALLERHLAESGLSYAVLRPAVLFGGRDVLINNIAWLLRRLPVFGVPGRGDYGIQPIHVDDLAELAVEQGGSRENVTLDAVGPETFSYLELVRLVKRRIGSWAPIFKMPPAIVLAAARAVGWYVGDVVLTKEEIDGLMQNLLVSDRPSPATTRFTDWLDDHADQLGRKYANELSRHFDGTKAGEAEAGDHDVDLSVSQAV